MNWKEVLNEKLSEKKWTKRYFSSLLGVSPQSLNNWINRNSIPKDKLALIAKQLGLSLSYLFRLKCVDSLETVNQVQLPMMYGLKSFLAFVSDGEFVEQLSMSRRNLEIVFGITGNLGNVFLVYGLSFEKPICVQGSQFLFVERLQDVYRPGISCESGFYFNFDGQLVDFCGGVVPVVGGGFCARLLYVWGGC